MAIFTRGESRKKHLTAGIARSKVASVKRKLPAPIGVPNTRKQRFNTAQLKVLRHYFDNITRSPATRNCKEIKNALQREIPDRTWNQIREWFAKERQRQSLSLQMIAAYALLDLHRGVNQDAGVLTSG
ncbi:hypothetical protein EWM64_g2170 [Hericium alpestre]|uniref:Homeobox domain-containing protein n=1 Tax=Hericium alpestre TaxID=135208 RepID=A0A4Z0A668_9AGAM|nr:hypothetical protein EWM64_g2170 [Hericium alpestre]